MHFRTVLFAMGSLVAVSAVAGDMKWGRGLQKGCDKELVGIYNVVCEPTALRSGKTPGFRIARPGFTLEASAGNLWAEDTAAGGPKGLYYEGEAKLSFSVEDPLEQDHLALFADGERGLKDVAIGPVYILPLGPCLDLPAAESASEEQTAFAGHSDLLRLKNALHEDGILWTERVLDAQNGSQGDIAILFRMSGNVWAYILDSKSEEEVSLRRLAAPPGSTAWWWDKAVSLHRTPGGKLVRGLTSQERAEKYPADTLRYDLQYDFDKAGGLLQGSTCTVKLKLKRPTSTLLFSMVPLLEVERVALADGTRVPFLKEDYSKAYFQNNYDLLVALPTRMTGEIALTFSLTGQLFENFLGLLLSESYTSWYPELDDVDGAEFSLRATTVKGYEAIGVGEMVEHKTGLPGERELWAYEMKERIHVAGMLLGKFTHLKGQAAGVELDVVLEDRVRLEDYMKNQKTVLAEMKSAVETYTKLFGPIPYKTVRAGMILGNTSLGIPTLLMLGPYIFNRDGLTSWPEGTVAHEMAHQWWFNQVTPASYRDAWVSEALAEYSTFLYMRERHEWTEAKRYIAENHRQMNLWSRLTGKPYIETGPVAMGGRLYTTLDPYTGYQQVVYYKGAWVILYLSKIAAFLKGGESAFFEGLKDLCANSPGRLVSCDDFRRTLEKHMGVDLKWYFQQWMEGTGLPQVKITTRVEGKGADTKLIVEGTQNTEMTLPIPVEAIQGDKLRQFLFFLKGKSSRAEFPLPFQPDKVKVDAYMVCPVEYLK